MDIFRYIRVDIFSETESNYESVLCAKYLKLVY